MEYNSRNHDEITSSLRIDGNSKNSSIQPSKKTEKKMLKAKAKSRQAITPSRNNAKDNYESTNKTAGKKDGTAKLRKKSNATMQSINQNQMNRKHSRMTLGGHQMDDAGGDSCVRLIIKTSKSSKKRRSQVRVGSE